MTVARVAESEPVPHPAALVRGGTEPARERVLELLASAGYADGAPLEAFVLLLPEENDAGRLRALRDELDGDPRARVLAVLPSGASRVSLRRTLVAGAAGILFDADIERALVPTFAAMLAGQLAVPAELTRQIAPRPLTHREKQILSLVVRGCTNREIANMLYLAESTVKTHLASSFRKLDARSRAEAVERIMDPENGYGVAILATSDAAA